MDWRATLADAAPDPDQDNNERDSWVGLQFTVSVKLTRRRGSFTDVIEARLTSAAIAVVAAAVIILALMQIFGILRSLGQN